jgi:putative DNA primase/helicase
MQRDQKPLKERAHGRWPGILSALGVNAALLKTTKHHPCPWCGGKDRFRFTDKDGDGLFFCGQCGSHSPTDFLMHANGWDFATAAKEIESVMGDVRFRAPKQKASDPEARGAMQRLWDGSGLIKQGDFVDRYLASRGIGQEAYPRVLRKIESAEHRTEDGVRSWHPTMVAKIVAPDGSPTNLHRTYLTLDGKKAAVDPVRKTMWGAIAPGSAIRLFETGPVMGVAEGIETAFAAAELFRIPVWSTINTTILAGWQPPDGVHQVIIFADNDPKYGGQAAAHVLAHKLACDASRNLSVRVELPDVAGQDWNDVLMQKRKLVA